MNRLAKMKFEVEYVFGGLFEIETDDIEQLWKDQKGIDPQTGKAWLTPKMMEEAKRLKALEELTAQAQELDMGY